MRSQKGFTLFEMAIVVVVISFILGALFVSKDIIRTAQIREMLGEYDRYIKAIKEFEDKYQALPGDMTNATAIWGADTGCPNTSMNTVAKTATCNGNGDGMIGGYNNSGSLDNNSYEFYRAWQQLANAGLIDGKYSGVLGASPNSASPNIAGSIAKNTMGISVPASKLKPGGWLLFYYKQPVDNGELWGDKYGHLLALTAMPIPLLGNDQAYIFQNGVLTGSETYAIDTKIDDGKPSLGKMRVGNYIASKCVTNNTSQANTTYFTSDNTKVACAPFFLLDF